MICSWRRALNQLDWSNVSFLNLTKLSAEAGWANIEMVPHSKAAAATISRMWLAPSSSKCASILTDDHQEGYVKNPSS